MNSEKEERTQYKAEIQEIDGKQVLVLKIKSETVTYPDGRQDVTIKAPSLNLIGETKDKFGADSVKMEIEKEDK